MPMQPKVTVPLQRGQEEGSHEFTAAEMGALAHLYRGEVYRSTIWRTRLDNTTNWAVVTTGIAFSIAFSGSEASPLPLVLVGLLVMVFILFEARRYRYFNVWRARCRHLENEFYAPILRGEGIRSDTGWQDILAKDYLEPHHHISLARACGRRLRSNYTWLLGIQALAYFGKLTIHPEAVQSWQELISRAAIGPVPGEVVILAGAAFHGSWIGFAIWTYRIELADRKRRHSTVAMG